MERTEWQLAPANTNPLGPKRYELVGASALILRLVCDRAPSQEQIAEMADVIGKILAVAHSGAAYAVAEHGWLVWTMEGLREAFRLAGEVEQRLVALFPRLESVLLHGANVRWGIWTDQYVLPFSRPGHLVVGDVTARAIFNFEPDNILFSSEAIYQVNRRWEHFVCAPRRLLDDHEDHGYRVIGHKRPSALDHAKVTHASPFVGRTRQLSTIDDYCKRTGRDRTLAIIAEAGSGKTRLIREWLARHAEIRAITANFSLFGGDLESFAGQLAELPPDRLDCDALVQAVVDRTHRDKIEILVLDDIHWAGTEGLAFVRELLDALSTSPPLVILASRPSGREHLRTLQPTIELKLKPLSLSDAEELARRLVNSKTVATAAAVRSKGNPLFIEQFAAWAAETKFQAGESGPRNLHQVIAARIGYLSDVRIKDIQQRLRWGRSWERQVVDDELGRLEVEIGLWLDRLETGDYVDRVEAARHLVQLERLDYEIFITSMLAGRPRPRSSRLREAIERLLVGSADQILVDLKRRAVRTSADKENVSREAERAGDVLFGVFDWPLAREFYELAYSAQSWHSGDISRRLDQCRCRSRKTIADDSEVYAEAAERNMEERPSVDALDLPYVWAQLAHLYPCERYFRRAAEAAEAINDHGLAVWAKRKATELPDMNRRRRVN